MYTWFSSFSVVAFFLLLNSKWLELIDGLFYFIIFFRVIFLFLFFDIYAHAFLLLTVSKEQNIFSLKIHIQNFSLLAMIFHSRCKYRLSGVKKMEKSTINLFFDCRKIYLFRCGFLKCFGRNFPREWKFIEIIEINLIESKWIRI